MRPIHKPTAVVAVAAAAILVTAGGAYGYWTTSGAGAGRVTVATVKPLVIKQVHVKDLALGRPADLHGTVTNPNDFQASLLGTVITVKVTFDGHHHGCDITNFAIRAPSTKATLIEANSTIDLDKGSITMVNKTTDQAACHGATLTLDYRLKQGPATPHAAQVPQASSDPAADPTAVATPGLTTAPTPGLAEGPVAVPTADPAATQLPESTATTTAGIPVP
jgi:hypothetical protein